MMHEPADVLKKRKTIGSLKDVVLISNMLKQKFSGSKKTCFVLTTCHLFEYPLVTSGSPSGDWPLSAISELSVKQNLLVITFKNGQDLRLSADSPSVFMNTVFVFIPMTSFGLILTFFFFAMFFLCNLQLDFFFSLGFFSIRTGPFAMVAFFPLAGTGVAGLDDPHSHSRSL